MLFFLRMNEQHLSAVALWPDGEVYPVASTLVPLYQQLHFIFFFCQVVRKGAQKGNVEIRVKDAPTNYFKNLLEQVLGIRVKVRV